MMSSEFTKEFLAGRISGKKANDALAPYLETAAVVETDALGPRLWAMARKGILAGMVALTALTAVAPAMAATLNLPTQAQATAYMTEASGALKARYGSPRYGDEAKYGVAHRAEHIVRVRAENAEGPRSGLHIGSFHVDPQSGLHVASPDIDTVGEMYGTCLVTYSTGVKGDYSHLNLSEGTDLSAVYQMKGVSECLLRSGTAKEDFLGHHRSGTKEFLAYQKTFGGHDMVRDVTTLLAAARDGEDTYRTLFDLESADALAKAANSSGMTRMSGIIKLGTLDYVHTFVTQRDGFNRLGNDDLLKLPKYADAVVRHAHADVIKADVKLKGLTDGEPGSVAGALDADGLPGAAAVARHAEQTGLAAAKGTIVDTAIGKATTDNCDADYRGSYQRQGHRRRKCELDFNSVGVIQVREATERYGADVLEYLNSQVPEITLQSSALAR